MAVKLNTKKFSKPEIKALDDAKRLLEKLIEEIGIGSDGWAVDILSHAVCHLILLTSLPGEIPPEFVDDWSAVEKWTDGEIRILNHHDSLRLIH